MICGISQFSRENRNQIKRFVIWVNAQLQLRNTTFNFASIYSEIESNLASMIREKVISRRSHRK